MNIKQKNILENLELYSLSMTDPVETPFVFKISLVTDDFEEDPPVLCEISVHKHNLGNNDNSGIIVRIPGEAVVDEIKLYCLVAKTFKKACQDYIKPRDMIKTVQHFMETTFCEE